MEKFQNIKVVFSELTGYFPSRMLMEYVSPWKHTLKKYFETGNSLKSKLDFNQIKNQKNIYIKRNYLESNCCVEHFNMSF